MLSAALAEQEDVLLSASILNFPIRSTIVARVFAVSWSPEGREGGKLHFKCPDPSATFVDFIRCPFRVI